MKSPLVMIVIATASSSALVSARSSTGSFVPREPGGRPAIQQAQPRKEVTGKIESIDLDLRTIRIEGAGEAIVIADATRCRQGWNASSSPRPGATANWKRLK